VSSGTGLIPLVVTILGLGVAAQVLADRLRMPSVLFLILAGIAVGPDGLDIVGLDAFGGAEPFSAIVGLSVAIIIFEGAFQLKLSKLRQTPREAFRLVTLGASFWSQQPSSSVSRSTRRGGCRFSSRHCSSRPARR